MPLQLRRALSDEGARLLRESIGTNMSTTNATNATVPSPTTCWSPQSPYPAEEPEATKAPVVNARRDEGAGPAVSIFCDLDGVLADFDAGVRQLTGSSPEDMPVSQMWRAISGSRARNGFFGSLDWMSDGEELWDAIAESGWAKDADTRE